MAQSLSNNDNHNNGEEIEKMKIPFVDIYFTKPRGQTYDWRGVFPRTQYISDLLKDVDLALKQSRAQWKIVVGHHTIKSAGEHGVTRDVEKQLLPILEDKMISKTLFLLYLFKVILMFSSTVRGIDKLIPVDVYLSGCPPKPEAVIDAITKLQKMAQSLSNNDNRNNGEEIEKMKIPFVDIYFTKPRGQTYDWRGVLPRTQYISNLLKDVDLALKQSRSNWKIVVGHHTIKSVGEHGVTRDLEKQLLPILECGHLIQGT
ncbi:unnamed protein product [Lupinus luteus]|uniref:NADH:ubiquinone oxidoreductase-like 20kDa subunit domain-containing protein n=1 Tax=Lupinus luteus TaxID=3873 RepID=A0AAV1Y731_LUPLU